jgi:3-hydroxyisobutyrate dehydrogenase-like beta-hydroxyacid dehydrogenase
VTPRTLGRVGQVGLGTVGRIFAGHLLAASAGLDAYDLDPAAADAVRAMGAQIVATPAAVAGSCDVVLVSLPDPPAVEAALLGPGGLVSEGRTGTVVVDASTVDPATSRRVAAAAAARGIGYLDAPISGGEPMSGGVDGARAANVTFMVGGEACDLDRARPLLTVLGSHVHHVGPAGAGTLIKLVSNLCSGLYALVAAEAFAIGQAAGFTIEQMTDVFRDTDAKSFFMTDYLVPRLLAGDIDPGFAVQLQLKDHRLAAALAEELDVPAPLNDHAISVYERMCDAGLARRDVTAAIQFHER